MTRPERFVHRIEVPREQWLLPGQAAGDELMRRGLQEFRERAEQAGVVLDGDTVTVQLRAAQTPRPDEQGDRLGYREGPDGDLAPLRDEPLRGGPGLYDWADVGVIEFSAAVAPPEDDDGG